MEARGARLYAPVMTFRPSARLALVPAAVPPWPAPAVPSASAASPEKVHRVEKLSDHAYAIFGRGGNIGLFAGDKEAVLPDSQLEPLAPDLLVAIATVTDKPLAFLVNARRRRTAPGPTADVNAASPGGR
jgi:hypothetical protein